MRDNTQRAGLAEWRSQLETLTSADIADAITYAVAAPRRVNVAELIVVSTEQG
jgi:NADP-dependent 3-hydroxy acid dehydrogenase YdfG